MDQRSGRENQNRYRRNDSPRRFESLKDKTQTNLQKIAAKEEREQRNQDATVRYTGQLTVATWIIAFAAILSFGAALLSWIILRSQLNEMVVDERPWVSVRATVIKPITFTDYDHRKMISVRVAYSFHNFGHAPARNVRVYAQILPRPPSGETARLDSPQQKACIWAQTAANHLSIAPTLFPDAGRDDIEVALSTDPISSHDPQVFSVQGCVDYTYASGKHGQTLFRLILGKTDSGYWDGLSFIEGKPLSNHGVVIDNVIHAESSAFDSAEDADGGNYAQ